MGVLSCSTTLKVEQWIKLCHTCQEKRNLQYCDFSLIKKGKLERRRVGKYSLSSVRCLVGRQGPIASLGFLQKSAAARVAVITHAQPMCSSCSEHVGCVCVTTVAVATVAFFKGSQRSICTSLFTHTHGWTSNISRKLKCTEVCDLHNAIAVGIARNRLWYCLRSRAAQDFQTPVVCCEMLPPLPEAVPLLLPLSGVLPQHSSPLHVSPLEAFP